MNIAKGQLKTIKQLAKSNPLEALIQAIDGLSIDGVREYEAKIQELNTDTESAASLRADIYIEFLHFYSHYASRIAYGSLTENGFTKFLLLFRKQVAYMAQERLRLFHGEDDYKRFPLKDLSDKIADKDNYYGHHAFTGKTPEDQDNVFSFLRDALSDIFGEKGRYHFEMMHEGAIYRVWVRNKKINEYIPELVNAVVVDSIMKNI